METAGDELLNRLGQSSETTRLFDQVKKRTAEITPENRHEIMRDIMQRRVDSYNASAGKLRDGYVNSDRVPIPGDGYNCDLCNNRGDTAFLTERNGMLYEVHTPCRCMEIRQSIWRMRQSGLESSIRKCTFERFTVRSEWQRKMLDTAKDYLKNGVPGGQWLFMGGAVGSGKTHICTAVARQLLYSKPVYYMTWPSESTRLKSIVNDQEEYGKALRRLKTIEVLYIDDFFKPVAGDFGPLPPTPADIRLAYEIIDHRYRNHMVTIISSERYLSELVDIDEAIGSRIAERSKGYARQLARDREKNQRLSNDDLI